ncbi:hypothetical protein AX760_20100 [Pararhizobium antarcticum]|uniref:Uncharacterized protein n=1 Tax=Pararhizobium antarcticum TaxID=1798805 RepID=A0A657LQK6_9HYPH|nr:hypothetical protein AX760_20100 [Pararhizobium antarcticum]OJF97688.1 hypothetical protein AX761_13910 [Rhizobium sp. 58]
MGSLLQTLVDLVERSSRKRAPDILNVEYLICSLSQIEQDRQSTSYMVAPTAQQHLVRARKTHAGIPIGMPEVEYDLTRNHVDDAGRINPVRICPFDRIKNDLDAAIWRSMAQPIHDTRFRLRFRPGNMRGERLDWLYYGSCDGHWRGTSEHQSHADSEGQNHCRNKQPRKDDNCTDQ